MSFKLNSLNKNEIDIIENKFTEPPFTGKYTDQNTQGTYLCKKCGLALFRSQTKFHSGCGWPSFDEEIKNAIKTVPDADGKRTEIICSRCHAHLGHVFAGEGFTAKNIRHCVNSMSLDFIENNYITDTQEGVFAAGCFWGVEHYFKKYNGVVKTEVGYIGGHKQNPSYEEVCSKKTGHYEAIRVVFDPSIVSFENLTKYFFEIHDSTQTDGQGPDIGPQYLSAIFYYNENQKNDCEKIIKILQQKNLQVSTKLFPVNTFWPAEEYHQNYYSKTNKEPYCHIYKKIF
jgi:peptide methionine sulfoxide reductase msrA/msrB